MALSLIITKKKAVVITHNRFFISMTLYYFGKTFVAVKPLGPVSISKLTF